MTAQQDPLSVECVHCHAEPGARCVTSSARPARIHSGREYAAAMAAAPAVDYSWADAPAEDDAAVQVVVDRIWPEESTQGVAAEGLAYAMGQAQAYLENVQDTLHPALDALDMQDASVVYLIDWCQQQRKLLRDVEERATLYAGQNLQVPRTGTMPDGRTYTIRRGQNRKAWDVDGWQRDARHAVIREAVPEGLAVLNPVTGEVGETARHLAQRVAAAVQAMQTAGPPRVTSLRGLGLDVDDYCAVSPGPWGIAFEDPTTDPTPTTEA